MKRYIKIFKENDNDSQFEEEESKKEEILHCLDILLNGDDVEFKPLDESDPIFAEIGFDISSQSGEDFVDSLSSQDVDNVYDILKTAGHLFKENFSYDIQDSSVGKNLDITDIIKKPTGNDLIQIKFKDHELRLTRIEAQELIDLLLKRLK